MLRIALAITHLLALGIGLGAVWTRARSLAATPLDAGAVQRALLADAWWGPAALLWIGSGLWRLLAGTEKATAYYLANHVFYAKMGCLVLILLLELLPMATLLRWRRAGAAEIASQNPPVARRIATTSYVQAALVVGRKFPDFDEKDIEGKPLSISRYKGKVVLVDFWATWCQPCILELPNVLAAFEKHHARGFEILGISLDKDEEALRRFIAERKMTWQQYFDGKVWENKLAQKYGVMGIPATYLLDANGVIIGKDLRGDELEKAVALAVAKK